MKKLVHSIVISAFIALAPIYSQPIWTSKTSLPSLGRHHSAMFTIGTDIYVLTGTPDNATMYKDVWKYNTLTDQWLQLTDFPGEARSYAATFVLNGRGYLSCGLGFNADTVFYDLWEFDPGTTNWTQKADYPGTARAHPAFFALKGEGYVGLGNNNTNFKDFYKYNPQTNKWTQIADYGGLAMHHPAMFVINDKGYVCTGHQSNGVNVVTDEMYVYDPDNNTWTQLLSMPADGRVGASGFSINGKGYIGLGYDEATTFGFYNDFYEYTPQTNSWQPITDFPVGKIFAAVSTECNNKGYVCTGMINNYGNNGTFLYELSDATVTGLPNENKQLFSIGPNPFKDNASISFNEPQSGNISVYNIVGEQVFNFALNREKNCTINLIALPVGSYLLEFKTSQGQVFRETLIKTD